MGPIVANITQRTIGGSFGSSGIKLEIHSSCESNAMLINLHGAFGTMYSRSGKYRRLAANLSAARVCDVVLMETSRTSEVDVPQSGEQEEYKRQRAFFAGKTFWHEAEDLKRVLDFVDGANIAKKKRIILNGNSMGGIVALAAASDHPRVCAISMVGTGLYVPPSLSESLSIFPPPDQIERFAGAFTKKVLLQYGTRDDIFDAESVRALASYLTKADTEIIEFPGVDHTFDFVDGKTSAKPYETVCRNLRSLIEHSA